MEKNIKNLILQIKKIAENNSETPVLPSTSSKKPPAKPGSKPPTSPSGPVMPSGSGGAPATTSETEVAVTPAAAASAVKSMQQAIREFADTVTDYDIEFQNVSGKRVQVIKADDPRKDFNDFIAERGSEIESEEWDPDPTATARGQKRATERIQLQTVINTLRRMGSAVNEKRPDGIWDFRTQNSIRTVLALTDSIIRIADDYNLYNKISSYFTTANLQSLKSLIPADYQKLTNQEKNNKAKQIEPLVKKATTLYKNFQKIILDNPVYKQYISGTSPLMTAQSGAPDPGQIPEDLKNVDLDEEYISNFQITAPNGIKQWIMQKVPLSTFKDMPGYLKFLRYIGYNETNGIADINVQTKILNEIMEQVF
jgi:hypothetical protein